MASDPTARNGSANGRLQRDARRADRHSAAGDARQAGQESRELGSLSLEAALEELDRIVAALEDGQLPLDESLTLYECGMRLTQRCQELLDTAELRVQRLRPETTDDVLAGHAGFALDDFEVDEE